MRLLTLTLSLLLASGLAQAQSSTVYQWKDSNGVTQYSERPPQGRQVDMRRINQRGAVLEQAAQEAAPAEPANCLTARKNLEMLASGDPVMRDTDGDGKPDAELSQEQRETEKTLAEATARAQCRAQG